MNSSKSLIAYFSRKGDNYIGGNIFDLSTGNTKLVANKIQQLTGSEVFEIETVKPYPKDYAETTNIAKYELRDNDRPELRKIVDDIKSFDVIYLGYPNWWGTAPMAVFTFLESYDFFGKTIVPYCTHEGNGMGNSVRDIKKVCHNAEVLPGLAIRGGSVSVADKDIEKWLKDLHLI